MNCTKIEKLLPLYVEGDLDGRETELIGAHLSSCDYCRSREEEFRASQERVHNFAVPDFGPEFYAGIRGAVLAEINSSPAARPTFSETLRTFFQQRPALAASLSLLVLLSALSFGLHSALYRSDALLTALDEKTGEFNPNLFPEASGQSVKTDSTNNRAGIRQPIFTAGNPVRQKSVPAAAQRIAQPERSIPQSIDAAASSTAKVTQGDAATGDDSSTQAIARMEFQTSDPNIRIIWLGRKASE